MGRIREVIEMILYCMVFGLIGILGIVRVFDFSIRNILRYNVLYILTEVVVEYYFR